MITKNQSSSTYEPDFAVPPGATLRETIDALGIDQRELADRTGMAAKTLNQIIHGKAPLTHQTAMLLERVTNVPARVWNNLEAGYREQLARLEARKQFAKDVQWLKRIPITELVARNVIEPSKDKVVLLERALAFFRVASVDAWHEGWSSSQFAFRKLEHASTLDGRLATWLQLAELQAEAIDTASYSRQKFQNVVSEIRKLTLTQPEEFVPQMISHCQSAGVALCLVPEIPRGKISGAAKWIAPNRAMIAMNLRGKKSDLFWFTFFHEAGHLLHDSKKHAFVDIGYSTDPNEHAANEFAKRILIPRQYDSMLNSLKTEEAIRQFASKIQVDPGVVVGRLQHEKLIPFSHLNHLKSTFQWA